jgi:hypothetical protein
MQAHFTLDHIHCLVAWIDMKFAAVFPTPGDENKRIGLLPENAHPLAALGKPARLVEEANNGHLEHGLTPGLSRGTKVSQDLYRAKACLPEHRQAPSS